MVSKYYGIIPTNPPPPSCHPPLISFTKHIHMNCEKASIRMDTTAASCNEVSITVFFLFSFFFPFSISKLRHENQPKNFHKINRIYTRKKIQIFPNFFVEKWWYIYDNSFQEFICTGPFPCPPKMELRGTYLGNAPHSDFVNC